MSMNAHTATERQRFPYRYFEAKVINNDGHIILKNPVHVTLPSADSVQDLLATERFVKNGILYINEAYLGENHYHVKDQGFDTKTGKQLWGLTDGQFYEFDRTWASLISVPSVWGWGFLCDIYVRARWYISPAQRRFENLHRSLRRSCRR